MDKLLLSVEEASEVLGVGKSTVYDLVRMRLLRSVKIGSRRKIPADACRELVERLLEDGDVA
jgi:excisionase family DNA binding protein